MNKHGLKYCPFCGQVEDVRVAVLRTYCYVYCGECYTSSQNKSTPEEVKILWNKRIDKHED